jgi:hypothetical protein
MLLIIIQRPGAAICHGGAGEERCNGNSDWGPLEAKKPMGCQLSISPSRILSCSIRTAPAELGRVPVETRSSGNPAPGTKRAGSPRRSGIETSVPWTNWGLFVVTGCRGPVRNKSAKCARLGARSCRQLLGEVGNTNCARPSFTDRSPAIKNPAAINPASQEYPAHFLFVSLHLSLEHCAGILFCLTSILDRLRATTCARSRYLRFRSTPPSQAGLSQGGQFESDIHIPRVGPRNK